MLLSLFIIAIHYFTMNGKEGTKTAYFCQLKDKPEILAINELFQCFVVLICLIVLLLFLPFFSF